MKKRRSKPLKIKVIAGFKNSFNFGNIGETDPTTVTTVTVTHPQL